MSTDPGPDSSGTDDSSEFVYRNMSVAEFGDWLSQGKTAFRNGRWLNWSEGAKTNCIAILNTDWNYARPFRISGTVLESYTLRDLVNEQGLLTGTEERSDGEVLSNTRDGQDPENTAVDSGGAAEKEG